MPCTSTTRSTNWSRTCRKAEPGRSWLDGHGQELSTKVHHHLREEEKKFFQVSGKILGDAEKIRLAKRYRRDYQRMHKLLREG